MSRLLGKDNPQVNLFAAAEAGKPVTIYASKPKTWWQKLIEKLQTIVWSLMCEAIGWILCLVWNTF